VAQPLPAVQPEADAAPAIAAHLARSWSEKVEFDREALALILPAQPQHADALSLLDRQSLTRGGCGGGVSEMLGANRPDSSASSAGGGRRSDARARSPWRTRCRRAACPSDARSPTSLACFCVSDAQTVPDALGEICRARSDRHLAPASTRVVQLYYEIALQAGKTCRSRPTSTRLRS